MTTRGILSWFLFHCFHLFIHFFHTFLLQHTLMHTICTVYVISRSSVLSWSIHGQVSLLKPSKSFQVLLLVSLVTLAQDFQTPNLFHNGYQPPTTNPYRPATEQCRPYCTCQQSITAVFPADCSNPNYTTTNRYSARSLWENCKTRTI